MTYFQAYLLTRLDGIQDFFTCITAVGSAVIAIFTICCLISIDMQYTKDEKEIKKASLLRLIKIFIPLIMLNGFIATLIPTTKEAAFIYIAPAIINNQDVQKTIKKLPELSGIGLEYLSEVLKEEVKDAKQEIKKQIKE